MQRRQLHRDARPFVDTASARRLADGVDGLLVVAQIAGRVRFGQRRFAEHVVGVAEAADFQAAAVGQRLGNGLAEDELLAHQPHGDVQAATDHRLAAAGDQAGQRGGQAGLAGGGGQSAGQQQAPGGGVHEHRPAAAQMAVPVGAADLVADQRVAGGGVGNAQQRLGQAHQRHAFLAGQGVFLQQRLHQAAGALGTQRLHQGFGVLPYRLRRSDRQRGLGQQRGQALRFRTAIRRGNGGTQHGLRLHVLRQVQEGQVGRRLLRRCARSRVEAPLQQGLACSRRSRPARIACFTSQWVVRPCRSAAAFSRARVCSSSFTPSVAVANGCSRWDASTPCGVPVTVAGVTPRSRGFDLAVSSGW